MVIECVSKPNRTKKRGYTPGDLARISGYVCENYTGEEIREAFGKSDSYNCLLRAIIPCEKIESAFEVSRKVASWAKILSRLATIGAAIIGIAARLPLPTSLVFKLVRILSSVLSFEVLITQMLKASGVLNEVLSELAEGCRVTIEEEVEDGTLEEAEGFVLGLYESIESATDDLLDWIVGWFDFSGGNEDG